MNKYKKNCVPVCVSVFTAEFVDLNFVSTGELDWILSFLRLSLSLCGRAVCADKPAPLSPITTRVIVSRFQTKGGRSLPSAQRVFGPATGLVSIF